MVNGEVNFEKYFLYISNVFYIYVVNRMYLYFFMLKINVKIYCKMYFKGQKNNPVQSRPLWHTPPTQEKCAAQTHKMVGGITGSTEERGKTRTNGLERARITGLGKR